MGSGAHIILLFLSIIKMGLGRHKNMEIFKRFVREVFFSKIL
jgi:hypothetical protein